MAERRVSLATSALRLHTSRQCTRCSSWREMAAGSRTSQDQPGPARTSQDKPKAAGTKREQRLRSEWLSRLETPVPGNGEDPCQKGFVSRQVGAPTAKVVSAMVGRPCPAMVVG